MVTVESCSEDKTDRMVLGESDWEKERSALVMA